VRALWAQGIAQSKTKVITKTNDGKHSATLTLGVQSYIQIDASGMTRSQTLQPHSVGRILNTQGLEHNPNSPPKTITQHQGLSSIKPEDCIPKEEQIVNPMMKLLERIDKFEQQVEE